MDNLNETVPLAIRRQVLNEVADRMIDTGNHAGFSAVREMLRETDDQSRNGQGS
jgi:hypothetical protein